MKKALSIIKILLLLLVSGFVFPTLSIHNPTVNFEKISVENLSELGNLKTFDPDIGSILDITFTKDGNSLLLSGQTGKVLSWDVNTDLSSVILSINHPTFAVFSSDGTKVGCLCGDTSPTDNIELSSLSTKSSATLVTDFGSISDLAFSSDGEKLILAGGWTRNDNIVQIWNTKRKQLFFSLPKNGWTSKVAYEPVNGDIIAAGYANSIELWSVENQARLVTLEQVFPISEQGALILPVGDVSFAADGLRLASMSPEGYVWLWDVKTGEAKSLFQDDAIIRDATQTVYSTSNCELIFSPDDNLLVTTNNSEIRIWDVSSGVLLQTINEQATNLAFNSQGTLMVTSNDMGLVTIWNIL